MNYIAIVAVIGTLMLGSYWNYSQYNSTQTALKKIADAQESISKDLAAVNETIEQLTYQPYENGQLTKVSRPDNIESVVEETIRREFSKLSNSNVALNQEADTQPTSESIAAFEEALSIANTAIQARRWTEAVAMEISQKSVLLTQDQRQEIIKVWTQAIEEEYLSVDAALYPPI